MRVIFEKYDDEVFFEIILQSEDLEKLFELQGILGNYICEFAGAKFINVFIRKEKETSLCRSKRVSPKRSFPKTFAPKCMPESRKNKQLPSLIVPLGKAKKALQKKDVQND